MENDPLIYWTTIGANLVTIGGALYGIPRALNYLSRSADAAEKAAKAQETLAHAAATQAPRPTFDWSVDLVYKMDASARSLEDSGQSSAAIYDALQAGLMGNEIVLNRIDHAKLKSKAIKELIDLLKTAGTAP